MYDGASPCDRLIRADGAAELVVGRTKDGIRLRHLYQAAPCRMLFPRASANAPLEAVVALTSGGIAGGDRLRIAVAAEKGASATVTTQAAEKVYRSTGPEAVVDVHVRVESGAFLEWMPQETILFDGARLRRDTQIDVAAAGALIAGEIAVFGRRARAETFSRGLLHDGWTIRRDGDPVWADALHLDGDLASRFRNRYTFSDAAALGVLVCCGPIAGDCLETARRIADGATRVSDIVIARFANADPAALRREFSELWTALRRRVPGCPARVPRVWEI